MSRVQAVAVLAAAGAVLLLALPKRAAAQAPSPVVTRAVTFQVVNPQQPWSTKSVRGTLYLPSHATVCSSSVILLMHGLSYGAYAWDFPLQPETYSMARALALSGYPAVAVDELGYGSSDHPNGYTLSVEAYGELTAQLVKKLRAGSYQATAPIAFQRVVLFGHSAGTEMSELAAGLHTPVDGLIAGAYTHFPSAGILTDVIASDTPRALLSDYVYFGETPAKREAYMHHLAGADPAVVALDTQLANLTPSGEILTIGNQPSRAAMGLITAPVLLLLAENDALFPPDLAGVSLAQAELALFLASPDRSLHVVPEAGHTFMLHPNAPATQQVVVEWLKPRLPGCGPTP